MFLLESFCKEKQKQKQTKTTIKAREISDSQAEQALEATVLPTAPA